MKSPKTQKGNPHKITKNQHVFPAASIKRFVNSKGFVELKIKRLYNALPFRPNDSIFCKKREWDQRAETGYMRSIEDSFQAIASKIDRGELIDLSSDDNHRILQFYALWDLRYSSRPLEDIELIGVQPGSGLSQDSEEILESKHCMVTKKIDNKCFLPGRFINGSNIQVNIDRIMHKYNGLKWGVVRSISGEFIVPDNFNKTTIIPISPKVILLGGSKNLDVSHDEVSKVNRLAIATSSKYYFSREPKNCQT